MLRIYAGNNSDAVTAKMINKAKKQVYQAEKTLMKIIRREAYKKLADQNQELLQRQFFCCLQEYSTKKAFLFFKVGWGFFFPRKPGLANNSQARDEMHITRPEPGR